MLSPTPFCFLLFVSFFLLSPLFVHSEATQTPSTSVTSQNRTAVDVVDEWLELFAKKDFDGLMQLNEATLVWSVHASPEFDFNGNRRLDSFKKWLTTFVEEWGFNSIKTSEYLRTDKTEVVFRGYVTATSPHTKKVSSTYGIFFFVLSEKLYIKKVDIRFEDLRPFLDARKFPNKVTSEKLFQSFVLERHEDIPSHLTTDSIFEWKGPSFFSFLNKEYKWREEGKAKNLFEDISKEIKFNSFSPLRYVFQGENAVMFVSNWNFTVLSTKKKVQTPISCFLRHKNNLVSSFKVMFEVPEDVEVASSRLLEK